MNNLFNNLNRPTLSALSTYRFLPILLALTLFSIFEHPSVANAIVPDIVDATDIVIINEIHYKPLHKTERVEFIELYNPRTWAIELSGWQLDGAVQYMIPANIQIPAQGYLIISQNPAAFVAKYGANSLGPFQGRLSIEGENVILRDRQETKIDEVEYKLGFPWPTLGSPADHSIQLIHSDLPNEEPASWRSHAPTPGQRNQSFTPNPPPAINAVQHSPQTPTSADSVTIVAVVADDDGIASVQLQYQIVAPGQYLRRHDEAYHTNWTALDMRSQQDGNYSITLPAPFHKHRHLLRYRIHAVDQASNQITVPYADDPQPNFAYFIYDGLPDWSAAIRPGDGGTKGQAQTYDFDAMSPLPVYHIVAQKQDVADAMFMPDSTLPSGYMGHDYLWWGTLVYGGQVYDHIRFRARGNLRRYATGKNMWKIDFNNGHWFQAYDNDGRPYGAQWDKLNLGSGLQHSSRKYRGEHGLFESASYRLFNLAGVEGPKTHFIHFRVIDEVSETGTNQYNHDFWGLYFAVEQQDGRFLDEHNLPDGNLYKMENYVGELNNQGSTAVTDHSDLNTFLHSYRQGSPDNQWWRDHFDLDRYYSYRAIVEAVQHYDINQGKNYFYYLNPETNRWSVHPWDLDISWMPGSGDGNEPFRDRILSRYEFNIAYQNRMREILDLLFNSEQVGFLIDELLLIDRASNPLSMADADRALWDYNPIFDTRYVTTERSRPGTFYKRSSSEDFAGMVQLMRDWVTERRAWISQNILTDHDKPYTPSLHYSGGSGNPVDQLRFQPSQFDDPQGNHTFGSMMWRIAEINYPGTASYVAGSPPLYEVDALWESDEYYAWQSTLEPPVGLLEVGHTYRTRVRMKDNSGRWSHWSASVEFMVSPPTTELVTDLKLTEIMYHPRTEISTDENASNDELFEFIELQNSGQILVNLSNLYFSQGIDYIFPPGTTLAPGQHLILAADAYHFHQRYGFAPFAEYEKMLSNKGEHITLVDAYERTIFSVQYNDKGAWPTLADGLGYSLVVDWPDQIAIDTLAQPQQWRASTVRGGSPAAHDPLPVRVNEAWIQRGTPHRGAIELFNPTDRPANISHWYLSDNPDHPRRVQLPANTIVPANGYLILDEGLYHNRQRSAHFELEPRGEHVYLSSATAEGRLTDYNHGFAYPSFDDNAITFGPHKTSDSEQYILSLAEPTLGQPNAEPAVGPLIISEIMYNPQRGEEYIKITNITTEDVPLYAPNALKQTWRVDGIFYQFPLNTVLAAGRSLLLVPTEPSELCVSYVIPDDVDVVLGPYHIPLHDNPQTISLQRPNHLHPADWPYLTIDSVAYGIVDPWPNSANGWGTSLQRAIPTRYGNDVTSWLAGEPQTYPIHAASVTADVRLCSFQVFSDEKSEALEVHWVTLQEQNIRGYDLWYSQDGKRQNATRLIREMVTTPVQGASISDRHHYVITEALLVAHGASQTDSRDGIPAYWLKAIATDGSSFDVASTTLRQPIYRHYFPIASGGAGR